MNPQKIGGSIVFFLGVPLGIVASDRMLLSSAASIGLMMIFFAVERINDERVQQLKMKALFTAMSTGFGLTFIAHHYLFALLRGTLDSAPPTMTALEFLAGILLFALGLFHCWRWQDARPRGYAAPEETGPPTFSANGVTFYRAPWSDGLKWSSLIVTVVGLGVGLMLLRMGRLPALIPAAILLGVLAGSLLFVIRGYAVAGDSLLIRRMFGVTRLPLAGLVSAKADASAMDESFRTFGNGGVFAFTGRFKSERLGSFRAYVTDPSRGVVLCWPDRTVVISPAAPEVFVQQLSVAKTP